MSKYDIRPDFECQNKIISVKIRYSDRFQIGFRIIEYDIRPYFECQNSRLIANVKIGF